MFPAGLLRGRCGYRQQEYQEQQLDQHPYVYPQGLYYDIDSNPGAIRRPKTLTFALGRAKCLGGVQVGGLDVLVARIAPSR